MSIQLNPSRISLPHELPKTSTLMPIDCRSCGNQFVPTFRAQTQHVECPRVKRLKHCQWCGTPLIRVDGKPDRRQKNCEPGCGRDAMIVHIANKLESIYDMFDRKTFIEGMKKVGGNAQDLKRAYPCIIRCELTATLLATNPGFGYAHITRELSRLSRYGKWFAGPVRCSDELVRVPTNIASATPPHPWGNI